MRAEQSRVHTAGPGQEEGGHPGLDANVSELKPAQRMSPTPAANLSGVDQQEPGGLPCGSWKALSCSGSRPRPPLDGWLSHGHACGNELRLSPAGPSTEETFNSSFSFIQQSLSSSRTAGTPVSQQPEPLNQWNKAPSSPQSKRPVQLPSDREELPSGERFWDGRGGPPDPADCECVDIEITSSLSVESDNASASSVTSGYESATPASEQGWDSLLKKYEVVLQDCLHNNRTYTKVGMSERLDSQSRSARARKEKAGIGRISRAVWISEMCFRPNAPTKVSFLTVSLAEPISLWRCRSLRSHFFFFFWSLVGVLICLLLSSQIESMMLKLQRLQQKAILDDDYDAGERPSPPMAHITEAVPSISFPFIYDGGCWI